MRRLFTRFAFCSVPNEIPMSLGIVDDRSDVLYVEFDDWKPEDCTPWVLDHVIPLLEGKLEGLGTIRSKLLAIVAATQEGQLVSAKEVDLRVLLRIIGNLPEAWETQITIFNVTTFIEWEKSKYPRHALEAARALRDLTHKFELENLDSTAPILVEESSGLS